MNESIVLYKKKMYVPLDDDLWQEVVCNHHKPAVIRHPGIQETFELVFQEYWWPEMHNVIIQYVKGCATCQTAKIPRRPAYSPSLIVATYNLLEPFQWIMSLDFPHQTDMMPLK